MELDRRLYGKKSGVSEVVGTILILSITVVLFSTIFATVSQLESPDRSSYTDMGATFYEGNKTITPTINITHQGGKNLETFKTSIFLVVDGASVEYDFNNASLDLEGNEDIWEIGEEVVIDDGNLPMYFGYSGWTDFSNSVDNIEILIMDTSQNNLIWNTEMSISMVKGKPAIKEAGVYYGQEWEDFVKTGNKVTLYAELSYPAGKVSDLRVLFDLGDINATYSDGDQVSGTSYYEVDEADGNRFHLEIKIPDDQENDQYLLDVIAHNGTRDASEEYVENGTKNATFSTQKYITLNVGPKDTVLDNPDLRVDANKMGFIPSSPQSGDTLTVEAVIENEGGTSAKANVTINDKGPDGNWKVLGKILNLRVAAGGGRDISATHNINVSGEHSISVNLTDIESVGGDDLNPSNNQANRTLYVQPKILIVDDDHETGEDTDVSKVKSALTGAGFSPTMTVVDGTHGPEWDGGRYPLKNYDIVIWVTGRTMSDTLTGEDMDNLEKYLDKGRNLWLIGEGIADEHMGSNFLDNYLQTTVSSTDTAPQGDVNGTDVPLSTTDWFTRAVGTYSGDYIDSQNGGNVSANDSAVNNDNGLMVSYHDNTDDYKTVFNSYRFGSMRSGKSRMAFKVIRWLGDIKHQSGKDLAVSDQEFSTRSPMYQDTVTTTATIRNNAREQETVNVKLKVDGEFTDESKQVTIGGDGNTTEVSFNWTAEPVGEHELKIVVDPFNVIQETNEQNNDITYQGVDVTVTVRYSIMLVDDDEYGDGDPLNSTQYLNNSLDALDYSSVTYVNVNSGEDGPDYQDDDPDTPDMVDYNAVYWVAGDDGTLTGGDVENITQYLDETTGASFFLTGDRVIDHISGNYTSFATNYLGIDPSTVADDDGFETEAVGQKDDPISHGMDYKLQMSGDNDFYDYQLDGAEQVLVADSGRNLSSRYNYSDANTDFRTVYSVDLAHFDRPSTPEKWYEDFRKDPDLDGDATREEYVYMLTKWMGKEDERVELRASDVDIKLSNQHPMLGRSYQLSVSIQNVGYKESNALVRFKDGDSLIASESMYVPPDSTASAEVNWQPLFAGSNRPIRVLVDPESTVEEIGNDPEDETDKDHLLFNNHAITRSPVYYFWDDMENGTDKWDHEANIMNINGEQPLGYLSEEYDKAYTDILSDWNETMSKRYEKTDSFSFSDPNSFWLNETLDESSTSSTSSGSTIMRSGSENELDAAPPGPEPTATELVDNGVFETDYNSWTLTELQADGVAEWDGTSTYPSDGTGSIHVRASATGSGSDATEEAKWEQSIGPTTNDITIEGAFMKDIVEGSSGASQATVNTATVRLSVYDTGVGSWIKISEDTTIATTGWTEFTSQVYNPSGEVTDIKAYMNTQAEGDTQGNTDLTATGDLWMDNISATIPTPPDNEAPTIDLISPSDGATGVSTSPTLSVDVSDPDGDSMTVTFYNDSDDSQIGQNTGVTNDTTSVTWSPLTGGRTYSWYAVADDGVQTNTSATWSFTTESTGDGDTGGFQLATGPNMNKTAVTPTFNLTDHSSAQLTFNQRYKITPGNGGLLEVGYNNGSEWNWIYMIPSTNTYTGNLNENYSHLADRKDSEDNPMDWCWNGVSGDGGFNWEYVEANILKYIPEDQTDEVRLRFNYTQYEKGTGYGWFIDNVKVVTSRAGDNASSIKPGMSDVWQYTNNGSHSGDYSWWNGEPGQNRTREGIDNSLITTPIALTNAQTATFSGYFKFNINTSSGVPPDGFRVEATMDNGVTWIPINMGVRTSWGVPGGDTDSYSGYNEGNYWTKADNLTRLNVDLSDFAGETISLRFRMVTTNANNYDHYDTHPPDFGGFYVDDIIVRGRSIQG